MLAVASYIRSRPDLPENVQRELVAASDQEVDEAWDGIMTHLMRSVDADTVVNKLVGGGWSYDTAYWLVNHARIHGNVPGTRRPSESIMIRRRMLRTQGLALIVMGFLVVAFIGQVLDHSVAQIEWLGRSAGILLIGFGIMYYRRAPKP